MPEPATLVAFVYDERPCLNLMRSLIRDARAWPELHIWDQSRDALITRTRSIAATRFLEQSTDDVLVMVDHDIGWEAGDLEHLVHCCRQVEGVVGGIYSIRQFGKGTAAVKLPVGVPVKIPDDRILECESVGTGFFAIHRKVLEAMVASGKVERNKQGWHPFFSIGHRIGEDGVPDFDSEDWWFCQLASELGFFVGADQHATLTHHGAHTYRMIDTTVQLPPSQSITLTTFDHTLPVEQPDGVKLFIDPGDSVISQEVVKGIVHDPEAYEELVAAGRPDRTLLEPGAHIGSFTARLAPLYEQVVAVEALPHNFAILERNIAVNERANVTAVNAAAGDHDGTTRIQRDYQNSGNSHLTADGQGEEVPMLTIATLCERYGIRPQVLKVDIEGADYLALAGGLPDTVEVVVLEYAEHMLLGVSEVSGQQYIDLLTDMGFTLRGCGAEAAVEVTSAEGLPAAGGYCNLVAERDCAKAEAA